MRLDDGERAQLCRRQGPPRPALAAHVPDDRRAQRRADDAQSPAQPSLGLIRSPLLVPAGTLTNVIEFEEGGFLRVGSTISPDAERGERFRFSFDSCAVRWRSLELPLPPVGRGWGELLYLDDELRVQRDVRGDLLVATRVG